MACALRLFHLPYPACRFIAIHLRHLDIHEDELVISLRHAFYHTYGFLAIPCLFNGAPVLLDKSARNLHIDVVVFHQKDTCVENGFGVFVRGRLLRALPTQYRVTQGMAEVRPEQRLGQEGIHARLLGFLLDLRPVVRRQDDDRHFIAHDAPDAACGFQPVHAGHFPIDNHGMVIPVRAVRGGGFLHGLRAGQHPFAPHADIFKHSGSVFADIPVIVDDEGAQIPQRAAVERFSLVLLQFQGERQGEGGPLPPLARHGDPAVHHVDDVLRDGHAEAGAFHLADGARPDPFKGIKDFVQKILRDADPGIADDKLVHAVPVVLRGQLADIQLHRPARLRELQGVPHHVQDRLADAQGVPNDALVLHAAHADVELQLLGVGLRQDDRNKVADQLRQDKLFVVQGYLAAFDLAHVQHVIDQAEQMPGRGGNLA